MALPDIGASRFLVNTNLTPRSDGTDETNSSYDDGPAENGNARDFPRIEHRLYVINRSGTGEASYLLLTDSAETILSYRVHTERWRPIEGVMNFGVVALGKFIYVIGGFHKKWAVCLNRVLKYDPCEGVWTECKGLITARAKFGACAVGSKIMVCGGEKSDGKTTASCETYDPEVDEWTKNGVLLSPRVGAACVSDGTDVLCAGGFHGGVCHNNLWVCERQQWQEMDELYPHVLPYNIDKCAVASIGSTFYFIGGVSTPRLNRQNNADNHLRHPKQNKPRHQGTTTTTIKNKNNNSNDKKTPAPEPPIDRPRFHTERRLFSYTTRISASAPTLSGPQPDLISPWNLKLPPMIHARHSAGAVAVGNKIHVVGGMSVETGQVVKVSEHYDLLTGLWEEDFTLRKCDLSNVTCVLIHVPKVPLEDRKNTYRLKWVMW